MIYLVRRSKSEMDEEPIVPHVDDPSPLSLTGQGQAADMGLWLKTQCKNSRVVIIHDPSPASHATADIISQRIKNSLVRVFPDLKEIDMGNWTGRPYDSLQSTIEYRKYLAAKFTYDDHDGESLLMGQRRIQPFLKLIQPLYQRTSVVIIARQKILSVIHALLCESRMGHGHMSNYHELIVVNPLTKKDNIIDVHRNMFG